MLNLHAAINNFVLMPLSIYKLNVNYVRSLEGYFKRMCI